MSWGPNFAKPLLCTVDVPWFVRMEGQRSFRPHTFSKHSQRQKASRSLQFTHSIFTGIYCAYNALSSARQCQGLVTQKTPLQNAPTPHKISPLGIGLLHMSKISYTFAKSFLRCQSYESELSTMPIETTWAKLLLRPNFILLHTFCPQLWVTKKNDCVLLSCGRKLYITVSGLALSEVCGALNFQPTTNV